MLKIGILGTRGIPNRYGGFEQFAEMLAKGLTSRGHQVYVYCSSLHPFQEKDYNGVHLIHCKDPENKFGTIGQFLYDRRCLKDAQKRNYDVLLHLGYTSDSVWHRMWPKNCVNMMNMDGMEWKRSKYNRLTRQFLRRAESLAAKHADILIADSIPIQQYINDKYKKTAHFIAYSALVFDKPNIRHLLSFSVSPYRYFLAIARMEPENNLEMIIEGYLTAGAEYPLLITGNTNNKYGNWLKNKYSKTGIVFTGPVYDKSVLDNLRYHASLYFHGHSVGGTNPSLLEAMSCSCNIAAHDNPFNKAILGSEAEYFLSAGDITAIIKNDKPQSTWQERKRKNIDRIQNTYSPEMIIDAYEKLMIENRDPQKQLYAKE